MSDDGDMDKSTWGDGPWQTEPDRAEWQHAGLQCLAVRNRLGTWCGYAAVPPSHPLHGQSYQDVDVNAHGGLTYANHCEGHICHVSAPIPCPFCVGRLGVVCSTCEDCQGSGEVPGPDNVWWFGFDCAHAGDFVPGIEATIRTLDAIGFDLPKKPPYDHAAAIAAHTFFVDVYRTLDYVRAEASRLAEQLAARAKRPGRKRRPRARA